ATSHAFGDVDADAKEALDARYPKERVRRVPRRSILIARLRRERILPDDATLEKIMRFETHLSGQLYQAVHELEAMQARREGEQTLLARLDVNGTDDPSIFIEAEPAQHLD